MFLKLSKGLIIALLAATVCSAASIVPRDENDRDGDDRAGKANAPAVCVVSYLFTSYQYYGEV
jgi:hypothetical protein